MKKQMRKAWAVVLSVIMLVTLLPANIQAATSSPYGTPSTTGVSIEETSVTLSVGQTKSLTVVNTTGKNISWSSSNASVASVSGGTITAKAAGTATITASATKNGKTYSDTCTVVVQAVEPTGLTITGADQIAKYSQVDLNGSIAPFGASGRIQWASTDDSVATVNASGRVTAVSEGTATIIGTIEGTAITASKTVTVTAAAATNNAAFYYLKTPTSNPASNDVSQWGRNIGSGKINITNATWVNNKNVFISGDPGRVISWPAGFDGGLVSRSSQDWMTIFNAFKSTVDAVNAEDVESITLVPYKISTNADGYHVDCTVQIKVKDLYTATYYVWDAASSGYVWKYAETLREGGITSPAEAAAGLPETKVVNNRTYHLISWYEESSLSGTAVSFPYEIHENTNFYAKYIADYVVRYDANGGTGMAGTTAYKQAGETVLVSSKIPVKDGFIFTGWVYAGKDYTGGDTFVMPEMDVTLVAQWKAKDILTVTARSLEEMYDGSEHTVSGFENETEDGIAVVFGGETYFVTGLNSAAKGTNVSDSLETIPVTGTPVVTNSNGEDVTDLFIVQSIPGSLTITKAAIEITVNGNQKETDYSGAKQTVTGYTLACDSTLFAESKVNGPAMAVAAGTEVDTYPMGLSVSQFSYTDENVEASFVVNDGALIIDPVSITINVTGNHTTKNYNGQNQSVNGYTLECTSSLFDEALVNGPDQSIAANRTAAGTTPMNLNASQFSYGDTKNVHASFEVVDGYITITEADMIITVIGNNGTYEYNGEKQTVNGYEISSDNSLFDASLVIFSGTAEAEGTDVSETPYMMGLTKEMFSYGDTNLKVTFDVTDGSMTITPASMIVTVVGNHDSKEYNASEQEVNGYTLQCSSSLFEEEKVQYNGEARACGEDVKDSYKMGLTRDGFTYDNENIQVTFVVTDGYLIITPAEINITIVGNHDEVIYNGSEQMVNGYTVRCTSPLFEEEKLEGPAAETSFAKGTAASETAYPMGLSETLFTYDDTNITVTMNVTDGYLLINPAHITIHITGSTGTSDYTGEETSTEGYTVSVDETDVPGLFDEDKLVFEGEAEVTETQVGEYPMGLDEEQFSYEDPSVIPTIIVDDGSLKITDKNVPDELVVTKSVSGEKTEYAVGDEILFRITVINIYSTTQVITITEQADTMIRGNASQTVAPGGKAVFSASHIVTEADLLAGEFINTVTATLNGKTYTDTEGADTEAVDNTIVVAKTCDLEEGSTVKAGDTVNYTVTVTNTGNVTIRNIVVTDAVEGAELVEASNVIASLASGKSASLHYIYQITEEDLLNGYIYNKAAAFGQDGNGEDTTDEDEVTVTIIPETPEESTPEESTPEESTPEESTPEESTPEESTPEESTPEESTPEESTPEESTPEESTPEESTPEESTPEESTPEHIVPENSTPADIIPGEDEEAEETYVLTIHYETVDGEVLQDPTMIEFKAGDSVMVYSPSFEGYAISNGYNFIYSEALPARNLDFTVIYAPIILDDPLVNPNVPTTVDPESEIIEQQTVIENVVEVPVEGIEIVADLDQSSYHVEPIEENQVPMASGGMHGEHKDCILHFLLVLAALIITIIYTSDRKKRQEKIQELKKELFEAGIDPEIVLKENR